MYGPRCLNIDKKTAPALALCLGPHGIARCASLRLGVVGCAGTVPVGAVVLVTVIGPVVAAEGTVAFSWVAETWTTVDATVPLNFTVELLLKPTPFIVTTVQVGPLPGPKPVIDSVIVKFVALVPVPAGVVTEILPITAPFGTTALIWVPDTNVTVGEALAEFDSRAGHEARAVDRHRGAGYP